MNNKIKNFFRSDIDEIKEYEILDSNGMVKLDAMENPFDLGLEFQTSFIPSSEININRYPDGSCKNLINKLKSNLNVSEKDNILIGNGSDELIQIICMAFQKEGNVVLCPEPTFSMYKNIAKFVGLKFESVFLKEDFSLDADNMCESIARHDPAIIFLAYPNNPTGNIWQKPDLKKIIESTNGIVVIDEAYRPFSGVSFIEEMRNYENLLIMGTLSKNGLAGLRLGYLIGKQNIIRKINKLRLPFNVNSISQRVSELMLDKGDYLASQAKDIIKLRELMISEMRKIEKIEVYDSSTNFVLFKINEGSASRVFDELLKKKILIKDMSSNNMLHNCLRVTVGTEKENKLFIQSLENALN